MSWKVEPLRLTAIWFPFEVSPLNHTLRSRKKGNDHQLKKKALDCLKKKSSLLAAKSLEFSFFQLVFPFTNLYERINDFFARLAWQRLCLLFSYEILRGKLARSQPKLIPFAHALRLTAVLVSSFNWKFSYLLPVMGKTRLFSLPLHRHNNIILSTWRYCFRVRTYIKGSAMKFSRRNEQTRRSAVLFFQW